MTKPRRAYSEDLLTDLFRTPLDPGYAEAALRRAAAGPATGWRRSAGRGLRAVAFGLIGLLLAMAYQQAVATEPETARARADLLADVRERQRETEELQLTADELRAAVARERDRALAGDVDAARLREMEAGTGVARVTGDGIAVRVADARAKIDPVTGKQGNDNPGVVLDRDLQEIANGLWRSGAEAIAINGQRLTATSTIRAAGGAILVDFRPVTNPYEVLAIGPGDMADGFGGSLTGKRFRGYAERYGMQFGVKKRDGLVLPAAPDPQLRFAHPPSAPTSSSPTVPASSASPTVPASSAPSGPVPSRSGGR